MTTCSEIVSFLDTYLDTAGIDDVSRNGLQVEGGDKPVERIGLAVDASMAAYAMAIERGCQMLIVHHGIIWGGLNSVTGPTFAHVKFLLDHGLALYASHLPLDLHPTSGNNAGLAAILGLSGVTPFGEYKGRTIGFAGECPEPLTLEQITARLTAALGGACQTLSFGPKQNRRIGVVSGGASDILPEAVRIGLDCYVTGEPSHPAHHAALEGHTNVVFCGHYHSETPGVKALGALLKAQFGVESVFLDIPTLV